MQCEQGSAGATVAFVRQRERPGRVPYEQYRKRFYDALLMAGLPEPSLCKMH